MGQALYRKYRSKKLSEIIGQEHITDTLTRALQQGKISHAYLFTGPRGVGKTSIARILAHEVNNLPYTDDTNHIDIIEIDAASNRRIDEIRDLRDKVVIAPTSAKYKVYIIDEVHMLTKEAFNALLKTLEEPPAHVIFILATTELNKLPETIVSRTQRYAFKPVEPEKVIAHLRSIARQEKITINDEALALLAAHGEGSFRDSIGLLDQIRNHTDKVEAADVQLLLGIPPKTAIAELAQQMTSKQADQAVLLLNNLSGQGFTPSQIAKSLAEILRAELSTSSVYIPETFKLLRQLLAVPASVNPQVELELIVLEAALSGAGAGTSSIAATTVATDAKPVPATHLPKVSNAPSPKPPPEPAKSKTSTEPTNPTLPPNQSARTRQVSHFELDHWPQVLETLKSQYNTLYGVARMAVPIINDGKLLLAFQFGFHQKRLNEPKNKQILASAIESVIGSQIPIECIIDNQTPAPLENPKPTKLVVAESNNPPRTATSSTSNLDIISNIFGGAELLES